MMPSHSTDFAGITAITRAARLIEEHGVSGATAAACEQFDRYDRDLKTCNVPEIKDSLLRAMQHYVAVAAITHHICTDFLYGVKG